MKVITEIRRTTKFDHLNPPPVLVGFVLLDLSVSV